jgi:hypothetical protein
MQQLLSKLGDIDTRKIFACCKHGLNSTSVIDIRDVSHGDSKSMTEFLSKNSDRIFFISEDTLLCLTFFLSITNNSLHRQSITKRKSTPQRCEIAKYRTSIKIYN